jgi:hypothetical protein
MGKIAGTLADLDLSWANVYLSRSDTSDSNVAWNMRLARLRQTVHGPEDFFNRSNTGFILVGMRLSSITKVQTNRCLREC